MENELIALFDSDGTLFDYEGQLKKDLKKIMAPCEKEFKFTFKKKPDYIENRIRLITSPESWWENLPKFKLGWDILEVAKSLGFKIMILTQAPRTIPEAWTGKKKCFDKNFGQDFDVTLTRNKGLVYGKVLVDDFPEYIEKWLKWRKRGLVIMPANEENKNFKHPQVIRYDGTNIKEVKNSLKKLKQ